MTGAEGRGCARCKRQPAHAAVHTMQACTGARDAPMAAVHRRRLTSDGAAACGGGARAALCRREGPYPGGDLHRPTTGVS